MMRPISRRRFLSIAACAGFAGPSAAIASEDKLTWKGVALGADVRITLTGPERITRPALARARLEIEAHEARFSLFRPDSDLVRLNVQGKLRDTDARWHRLLATCDRLHRVTGGVFDPTIQPLWQAHAHGGDIEAARALVGWERVILPSKGQRGVQLGEGQALSFNGIAQGAATDAVRRVLVDAGLSHVLIDIGETAAIGGPWRIGLSDPEAGLFAEVALTDMAVAVSSPGALRLSARAQHILHPFEDAAPLWSNAAVIAKDTALADGLSTAACFLSTELLSACIAALPQIDRIIVLDQYSEMHVLNGLR